MFLILIFLISHLSIYTLSDDNSEAIFCNENGTKYYNCIQTPPRKQQGNTHSIGKWFYLIVFLRWKTFFGYSLGYCY
jgi:hypothetical protein